ncbi:MAG: NAD(P)H-dependent oxidoreductase [Microbacteriaceae bacterium]|nr:NAD(P)H-dependent oxidoreductase [Microbacteriaceae bacterium]
MSTPRKIALIVASTRTTRFADAPLAWLRSRFAERADLEVTVVDLRDHPLPCYDLPVPPSMAARQYNTAAERELGELLDAADGYIILANEYNHGYTASLKNTLDHYMAEFEHKPVAFVGYGNVGGARAIEQLREVAVELDMVPVKHAVHILGPAIMAIRGGEDAVETLAQYDVRLEPLLGNLGWWVDATAAARAAVAEPVA